MMPLPWRCLLLALPLAGCGPKTGGFDPNDVQLGANGKTIAPGHAAPTASPVAMAMIPFAGSWGRTTADCDLSNDARRGTLKIEAGKVDYYAAGGPVARIVATTPTSVTVDLQLKGFAGRSMIRTRYRLLVGGTRLERLDQAPPLRVVYTRC
ncbi:hypothetical protein [Sphingomonas sp. 28-63-12]|uniref:hypothetical protein n=1 Tax=Sphingomonas sp. 28-63-12 TaxID=1970434 RepID=UPI000BD0BEA0|nr:MAG: hypothetical protein B7Y47_08335 [Sphingomonas sp. 28-63-12]